MEIKTLTRRNKKHYIDQILTTISEQGIEKSPIWLSIRHEDVTNRQAFAAYDKTIGGLTIIPRADYKPAKTIVAKFQRMSLSDLKYKEEPAQIAYSAQVPLKECLWQINRLFHTCFHPSEKNINVEIVSKDKIKLSVTDDNHLLFNEGELILPAVDVSITLVEMVGESEITLNKEDCIFALNLYGRKTDLRKQEQVSWNAYDALFMAIALRNYPKNGTRDGLNEYALDQLPPHHMMLIRQGLDFGELNRSPFIPTLADSEQGNTLTSVTYRPLVESYPTSQKNNVTVHYRRFDIQEYLKEFYKSPTNFDVIRVQVPNVHNRSKDDVVLEAFKTYLNFNNEKNIVGHSGHLYNQDILVRRQDGKVVFDFVNHPLLTGEVKVDFGDA